MSKQRTRDTDTEIALRRQLHARGVRYRLHLRIVPGTRREVDIVIPRARLAVFVDGCFWHGCPVHESYPRANGAWWRDKIEGNQRRDADTDERLSAAGWRVIRVWEHEDPDTAAEAVLSMINERQPSGAARPPPGTPSEHQTRALGVTRSRESRSPQGR
jgi:DNA mismatch endonuclease (patch repair protein)